MLKKNNLDAVMRTGTYNNSSAEKKLYGSKCRPPLQVAAPPRMPLTPEYGNTVTGGEDNKTMCWRLHCKNTGTF